MIDAKVIADSVSPLGDRITTLQLIYPRFIHAEFMTHRVFSRNASSSRAIPVQKMLDMVRSEPAMPVHWGKNQAGMQAKEELNEIDKEFAKTLWVRAANDAANIANQMMLMGVHKQITNRILEPFQHIQVVVTATDWLNFFQLRAHPDAQPEINVLAIRMRDAMHASKPELLTRGQWHLPYITEQEKEWQVHYDLRKLSAARCARVSYLKHDGTAPDPQADLELYDRLVGSAPIHASPIEHQATPMSHDECRFAHYSGNFRGWTQYRKLIERGTH